MTQWAAKRLRYTLFPTDFASEIDPDEWWSAVASDPPEQIQQQPRMQHYVARAAYNEGTLVLEILGDRINWLWFAEDDIDSKSADTEGLGVLGDHREMFASFSQMLSPWLSLSNVPAGHRIAFGAELVDPVPNREDGYRTLQPYLPNVKLDPEGTSDFLYQINRPRTILIYDQEIPVNRLTKWGVLRIVRRALVIGGGVVLSKETTRPSEAVSLELDINTSAEYKGAFDGTTQKDTLDTLMALAVEIAEKGDIP